MNWKKTCRVCLQSGDVVSLFDWDDNNEQLCDKYEFCCGVKVPKDDNLPTLICLNCVDRLAVAYDFRKQCISSNETLQECLDEFLKTSCSVSAGTPQVLEIETITIKQENGVEVEYELPVEYDESTQWTVTNTKDSTVVTKQPGPRKVGRPRKYPNIHGEIKISPYTSKKSQLSKEDLELVNAELAALTKNLKPKTENTDTEENDQELVIQTVVPETEEEIIIENDEDEEEEEESTLPRKRGRPRSKKRIEIDETVNAILKATVEGFVPTTECEDRQPQTPKPKKKKKVKVKPTVKKKYFYDKTHKCETCGDAFPSNAKLQAHIRRHLGINPYSCSICNYTSPVHQNLKRHLLIHTNLKPYKCTLCPKAYKDSGDLKKHMRTHTGIRPFKCLICKKTFTYSSVLTTHMITHTREEKFECLKCHKKFTRASHMKYHNKVHHKSAPMPKHSKVKVRRIKGKSNSANKALDKSGVVTAEIVDGVVTVFHRMDEAVMEVAEEQELEYMEASDQEMGLEEIETIDADADADADADVDPDAVVYAEAGADVDPDAVVYADEDADVDPDEIVYADEDADVDPDEIVYADADLTNGEVVEEYIVKVE